MGLQIVDKSGQVVRRFAEKGFLPRTSCGMARMRPGFRSPTACTSTSSWSIDEFGDELVAHLRTVEITTEGPKGTVPVITETATKQ